MTGKHRPSAPMHSDDPVAPGVRRSKAAWITALGLVIILGAIVGISLTLSRGVESAQQDASLSKDETRQLREFLADRGKQRDAERTEVQQQLDYQRAVLCAAISTLSASARPEARAVLLKAASDLRCAALPRHTPATPSSRSTPSPATTTPARSTSTGDAAAVPRASVRPSGAPVAAGTAGPPRSTVRPSSSAPSPTPAAPKPPPRPTPSPTSPRPSPSTQPGLLDPVTAPVCNLLHVCL